VPGTGPAAPAASKKSLHASERDTARVTQARAEYQAQVLGLPLERLKFIDESGVNVAMPRPFGRTQ